MSEENLGRAYGLGAEAMKVMANLARQVKAQCGQEEDVRLLANEQVLERVAKVLARAGQLTRKFSVNTTDGSNGWIEIFLVNFVINTINELGEALKSCGMACLATKAELDNLWQSYPGFLQDEDELIIVGSRDDEDGRYWVMSKTGVVAQEITKDKIINNNYCFALII